VQRNEGALMARTFYRIYLYLVLTLLLNFAAIVTSFFLAELLVQAAGGVDSGIIVRQIGALASVSLLVTAVFGGLHYWLIRRDIAHDPGASKGPVRSLFLNYTEATSAVTVALAGAIGFTALGPGGTGAIGAFGPVVAFGILFVLLEVERRRGQPEHGGAVVLQRLHFYGIELNVLFIATGFALHAIGDTVSQLIISTGYAPDPCVAEQVQYGYCSFNGGQYLGGDWLAVLWLAAIWVAYRALSHNDLVSRLRSVFHLGGLAFSVILVLIGVGVGANVLLRSLFGVPAPYSQVNDPAAPFENAQYQFGFIAPLAFGLAVLATYWLLLRWDARRGGAMGRETTHQTSLAVVAALAAIPFWVGCALTLGGLFERAVPNGSPPDAAGWAEDLAFIVAGIVYVPLALWLSALARRTGVATPRRGFVYALLALGTLGAAFSLIAVLYAFVANALNSPLPNWEQLARLGTANVIVGAILVGIYVFIARREGWFTRQPTPSTEPAAVPSAETLESVLDELTARRLTRDEAAARIRALSARGL
jgi:hypothetical protein